MITRSTAPGAGLGVEDDRIWAIQRFAVEPGIHRVITSRPASVVVAGWRGADGFAYLGGWGSSFADFKPEGRGARA